MDQERAGRHDFRIEICGIDNFARFCALICGWAPSAESQAQINALAEKLNQASTPLEAALDQQKGK